MVFISPRGSRSRRVQPVRSCLRLSRDSPPFMAPACRGRFAIIGRCRAGGGRTSIRYAAFGEPNRGISPFVSSALRGDLSQHGSSGARRGRKTGEVLCFRLVGASQTGRCRGLIGVPGYRRRTPSDGPAASPQGSRWCLVGGGPGRIPATLDLCRSAGSERDHRGQAGNRPGGLSGGSIRAGADIDRRRALFLWGSRTVGNRLDSHPAKESWIGCKILHAPVRTSAPPGGPLPRQVRRVLRGAGSYPLGLLAAGVRQAIGGPGSVMGQGGSPVEGPNIPGPGREPIAIREAR
jgi:hypothetical protein